MICERAVTLVNRAKHQVLATQFDNFGIWVVFRKFRSVRCGNCLGVSSSRGAAVGWVTPSDGSFGMVDISSGEPAGVTVAFCCEDKIIFLNKSQERRAVGRHHNRTLVSEQLIKYFDPVTKRRYLILVEISDA